MRGVDFEIEEGEVFGLLGPNGAGKTTTVEILEGYRERDAGEVSVLGHDPQRPPREFRERIGVVLQQSQLWQNVTVREMHRAVPALLAALASRGLEPTALTTHHATLEDVFMSLTGRRLRDG